MEKKWLLNISNLKVAYETKVVLSNVNLKVYEKDFIGIIGPNGGGKTTLLKSILGLIAPLEGKVEKAENIHVGYLPQLNRIDKHFPIQVIDVLLSGLMPSKGLLGRMTKTDKEKAHNWLKQIGLQDFAHRSIGTLSGGQMQKVFLGRAIINNPDLLILDEPGTYVDKNFEMELYPLLQELNKEMAILLVSHDLGIISPIVKSIACVNGDLHYHPNNLISNEILKSYNCPVEIITHGMVPHRVLLKHE